MIKKTAVLFAILALLPALAAAQSLDWTRDPVAQFKTWLSAAMAPAARPVALNSASVAQPFRLYAQAIDGQWVSVPYCKMSPVKGKVSLALDKNNNVEALFTDADGGTVRFSFPTLTVSGSDILIDNAPISNSAKLSLDAGYSLQIQYSNPIDCGTGADRVKVDVFIQGPLP